jgi:hypothetical protein
LIRLKTAVFAPMPSASDSTATAVKAGDFASRKMHGLGSFAQEARRAVRIRVGTVEVRVLPLARIIASKRATDRPEDRAILPAVEDALRVLQSRKRPARR